MSNPFNGTPHKYFQIPQFLIADMLLQQLTGNELFMLVCLYSEAQRTSKGTITLSHVAMIEKSGVSSAQVGTARTGLVSHGLIAAKRVGRDYAYTLCDPSTGLAIRSESKSGQSINFDSLTSEQLRRFYLFHLKEYGVRDCPNGMESCCPFHDDHTPSLSITLENGSAWQCHRCEIGGKLIHLEQALAEQKESLTINPTQAYKRVVDSLRASGAIDSTTGKPEAIYPYVDEYGNLLFEVLRFPGKKFMQRRTLSTGKIVWDVQGCRKVLYRLEDVRLAGTVIVTEGEKDADRLETLCLYDDSGSRIATTTNAGGAGKWTAEHALQLEGKRVLLIGDNDEPGRDHMAKVAGSLAGVVSECAVMYPPESFKDISDFLELHSEDELLKMLPVTWIEGTPSI